MSDDTAKRITCTSCGGADSNCRTCSGRGGWPGDDDLVPGTLAEITGAPRSRADLRELIGETVRIEGLVYGSGERSEIASFLVRTVADAPTHIPQPFVLPRSLLEPRLDSALELESRCYWPSKLLKQTLLAEVLGARTERSIGRVSNGGTDFRLRIKRPRHKEQVTAYLLRPRDKAFKIGRVLLDSDTLGHLVKMLMERYVAKTARLSVDVELLDLLGKKKKR